MSFVRTLCRSRAKQSHQRRDWMPRSWAMALLFLFSGVAISLPAACAGKLQITEFMAINDQTMIDDDDDRSDWIEIHNPTKAAVNLDGWRLTDVTDEWRFPGVILPADGCLVVFASNKDRAELGAPLHTNFGLSGDGEYLGLLDPDGNVVSHFFPTYPRQQPDVSYGLGLAGGPEVFGYFETPTPGAPNGPAYPGIAGKVCFSTPGGTFLKSLSVGLELPDDATENAMIRYTLDGSVPNEFSVLYTQPLVIKTTMQVRAKVFEPGLAAGPTVSETYIALSRDVVDFSSNLPLVALHNFGGGWMPQNSHQPAVMAIFEQANGRSSLTNPPDLETRAGIQIRGSSTAGRPKPSLSVEAWNEVNENKNISPLGMPGESDWVLWGPYNFDLALMRNPLIYELSNQVGRYATRTRFVEVFLNTGGGALSSSDYWGVYALIEKIGRDEDRVDVEKLFPEHDREPGVTGGYMLKIDRLDPGDSGFYAAGQALCYVYPKEVDLERPERDAQEQYIRDFLNEFGTALNGPDFADSNLGYPKYLDADAAIDHHLLNVLTKNPDAFRLSTYMYKPRGGKLTFGPIWDFDRTMGSTDGRDADPLGWEGGTDFFNYPWWGRMFQDPNFFQKYIDRWQELRRDQLSVENIHSIIDSMADEIREAQVRDLQRWNQSPRWQYGGTFQGEVEHLKDWLATRAAWMDSQFVAAPLFSSDGGHITPGFTLTMKAPAKGTIYYTLDGSDPLMPGGKISRNAQLYAGPITLTDTAEVRARVRKVNSNPNPNNSVSTMSDWSGLSKARFSIYPAAKAGDLVMTEINYHPLGPTADELMVNPNFVKEDFEFIELKNIGTTSVDLAGVRFTNGIVFSFAGSSVTTLHPGELMLVVKNLTAFRARYGKVSYIAGQYTGNLDNGGENLRLDDAVGEIILDFDYQDGWYPITDGFGFSLVILNENAVADTWGTKAAWRSSTDVGGSPGEDDQASSGIPGVVINEALTHADVSGRNAIELHNPTVSPVNVGGWFLTDDRSTPKKFRIPDGTMISARGYLVFDEGDFKPTSPATTSGFSLSPTGGELYLFSADADGNLTDYLHGFEFGAAENGVSFGRHVTSTGEEHFVAQLRPTLNAANAGPRVGPVIISELMYHPADGDHEFLELLNISGSTVRFYHPQHASDTWRVPGIAFTFPRNVELSPGERLLLVRDTIAPSHFRMTNNIPASVEIFGYSGALNNAGETIGIRKPDVPDEGGTPYIVVDEVEYNDCLPWPTEPDGQGPSLERIVLDAYGSDVANWKRSDTSGGTPGGDWSTLDRDGDGMPDGWEIDNGLDPLTPDASGDADADGLNNLDEYQSGTHPNDSDTDRDGLSDGAEVKTYRTDPNHPDTDKDGVNDGDEVLAGTDPLDAASLFTVVDVSRDGKGASIEWTSVPGRQYAVYRSGDLVKWSLLEVVIADAYVSTLRDRDAVITLVRFYRIEVLPPQL